MKLSSDETMDNLSKRTQDDASNNVLQHCSSLSSNKNLFKSETIQSLDELGEVLRRIHRRLVSEGYEIFNEHDTVRENEDKNFR